MTSARCPQMSRACSTAYGLGCRCDRCRDWNAGHSRRGRKVGNRTFTWPREVVLRRRGLDLDALVEEFVQAVRVDPGYLIEFVIEFQAAQENTRSTTTN